MQGDSRTESGEFAPCETPKWAMRLTIETRDCNDDRRRFEHVRKVNPKRRSATAARFNLREKAKAVENKIKISAIDPGE